MIKKCFMQGNFSIPKRAFVLVILITALSCKKESTDVQSLDQDNSTLKSNNGAGGTDGATSQYDLEVVLQGEGNNNGHIHFRQDPDPAKIITLDTKIHHLLP